MEPLKMTDIPSTGINVQKSRHECKQGSHYHKGHLLRRSSRLMVIIFIALITFAPMKAKGSSTESTERTAVYYRIGTRSSTAFLATKQGVRNRMQCAAFCNEPNCSGFEYFPESQNCKLFTGLIVANEASTERDLFRKKPVCSTDLGFTMISGLCLAIFPGRKNAEAANTACQSLNGVLANPSTESVYTALDTLGSSMRTAEELPDNNMYIGLTRTNTNAQFVTSVEKKAPARYDIIKQWNEETCAVFRIGVFQVYESSCTRIYPYACQILL